MQKLPTKVKEGGSENQANEAEEGTRSIAKKLENNLDLMLK